MCFLKDPPSSSKTQQKPSTTDEELILYQMLIMNVQEDKAAFTLTLRCRQRIYQDSTHSWSACKTPQQFKQVVSRDNFPLATVCTDLKAHWTDEFPHHVVHKTATDEMLPRNRLNTHYIKHVRPGLYEPQPHTLMHTKRHKYESCRSALLVSGLSYVPNVTGHQTSGLTWNPVA